MGGTRYCPVCQGEDGCYYFTPTLEAIQHFAGFDEGKETEIAEAEADVSYEKLAGDLRAIEEISNERKPPLSMKPYFQEGGITIYHGDCREVLPTLGIYDLCLTDPPYGIGMDYDGYNDSKSNLRDLIKTAFPLIRRSAVVVLLTPGNSKQYMYPEPDWTLCWFYNYSSQLSPWGAMCWQPILAYGADPYLREGEGPRPDAFMLQETSARSEHPTPKPEKIWKWLMKRGASRPTDTIIDPFLGSGTSALVAKELGHKCIGIEQSEKYCEIAAKRLSQGVLEL